MWFHPERLRFAPDPEDARRRFDRLVDAGVGASDDPDVAEVMWIACTVAPYLTTLAVRDPGRLVAAATDPFLRREKPRERIAAELAEACAGAADADALMRALRAYRAREYIRLGARECGLGAPAEVGRELSALADASLAMAIAFHDAELAAAHGEPRDERGRAALCAFGMGKLGGEELNFSSDIDLIFVYSSDAGDAGGLSLHEYFDKVARRVTRTIGQVTEDGAVFRVDLRLRPEGTRGPLVNSLPSLERYYETWGRPWERQAWLKARPSAGSLALGEEVLAVLRPFIYPRTTTGGIVRDIAELNRRIKAELEPGTLEEGFDVKLGEGGIREIEFFVQALQLLHAGKNPVLRERSTRGALERLFFAGLVSEVERRALADAYDLLRQIEHRLQLEAGRQTHRLPRTAADLEILGRRLGFADAGELMARLAQRTREVAQIFATLGVEKPFRPELLQVVHGRDVEAGLAALGFRDPAEAAHHLDLLRRRPSSPFGAAPAPATARVAPALLDELAASPDPDQALRLLVDFVPRVGDGLWQLVDENRPVLRLLATLFGTSAFLAKSLIQKPELIDAVLLSGLPRRTRADLVRAVAALPVEAEAAWNALRRLKTEELLRIGLADVAGELDLEEVFAALSDLAEVLIARTFELVRGAVADAPPLAVLALGKLGARELGYASDLDLVFVFDGGVDDMDAASRLGQRLVGALGAHLDEGRLYEVDTRLRPSGRQGTLVSSLASWQRYHAESAAPWERQALVRARVVCGDAALGAKIEEDVARFVYGPGPAPAEWKAAIAAMRERIDRELGREGDLKAGRGGILDIEFATQYLQLAYGGLYAGLRTRSTLDALRAAREAGLIDDDTYGTLDGGYRFLRKIENRLRIVHDRPIHEFPKDPEELDKLARRAGFASAMAMLGAYRDLSAAARAAFQRLLA